MWPPSVWSREGQLSAAPSISMHTAPLCQERMDQIIVHSLDFDMTVQVQYQGELCI